MHQVAQMRAIYSNATEVVMWLGPGHQDIENLSLVIDSHRAQCGFLDQPVTGCSLKLDDDITNAIDRLIGRTYWSRVWIIQEVVVAKNARIMCGTTFLNWDYLTQFLKLIRSGHIESDWSETVLYTFKFHTLSMPMLRLDSWSKSSTSLAQVLDWSASSLATDGRDKVYALLGLVATGAGKLISADYTFSACNVYCLAIRAMSVDCDLEQRKYDFRREINTIEESCLSNALLREQASATRELRQVGRRSKKSLSASLNHSGKDTWNLDTGCDGISCGSKTVMRRFARWLSVPDLTFRSDANSFTSFHSEAPQELIPLHEFFTGSSAKRLLQKRNQTTANGNVIAKYKVLARLSMSLHLVPT